jgi:hypothetical protein
MMLSLSTLSWIDIIGYLVILLAAKRIYYELTTGAARRDIIKKHGCEPVYHWSHQGIFRKVLCLDVIQQQMKDAKMGRGCEASRQMFFKERNTIQTTLMRTESELSFHDVRICYTHLPLSFVGMLMAVASYPNRRARNCQDSSIDQI